MKTIQMEASENVVVTLAGLFNINSENVEKEVLVNEINEAIEKLNNAKPAKAGKWYENTELAYKAGDMVEAVEGWAKGRIIQIEKPSAKVNAFKGYLVNPKDGTTQGTLVGVDEKDIKPYVKQEEVVVSEEEQQIVTETEVVEEISEEAV